MDGTSANNIFASITGFTYNDLILLPRHIIHGLEDINLNTRITKNISIKTPIVSSPMDTVTEANMAMSKA